MSAFGFGEETGLFYLCAEGITSALLSVSLYAHLILALIVAVLFLVLYERCRTLFQSWNPDDDEEDSDCLYWMNQISSFILLVTAIVQVLLMTFMALGFIQMNQMDAAGIDNPLGRKCFWMGIVLCSFVLITAQQKVVNFTKELNPEKRGSIFDKRFHKIWLESCDEAEKRTVFESAFTSYKATNIACMLMWFYCIAGIMVFDFGIAPVFIVTIIWLTSSVSYCIKAMAIEKNSKKRKAVK